jgi:homoserine O-succinyltransferase/O-acetyltransferase
MPILVDRGPAGCEILASRDAPAERQRRYPTGSEWIEIGLLNNMPEPAFEGTEQQFIDLLGAVADDSWVHLRFFHLPGLRRSERARTRFRGCYLDVDEVGAAGLDGLIVTGAEPKAESLADEPYWKSFTKLVDWAERNTRSTIWSCLASHAAVLHLDGIERVPLGDKRFGLFACERVIDHPLLAGLSPQAVIPHSRWNDLAEAALLAKGYQVLMRSAEAGVDSFARQGQSLFVFFQGHPEYEARTLANEYRRDVGRFLRGERDRYPVMPQRYFDERSAQALAGFERRARAERSETLMNEFPAEGQGRSTSAPAPWHPFAAGLYRNWLTYLAAQKRQALPPAEYLAALRLDKLPAPAV